MKIKAKKLVALTALLLAILMLCSCAKTATTAPAEEPAKAEAPAAAEPEKKEEPAAEEPAPVEEPEEEHEPVVLEMITHSNAPTDEALAVINEKFTEKYPWITVNVTTVESGQYGELRTSRIAANDVDILEISCFQQEIPPFCYGKEPGATQQLIEQGYILDMTDQDFIGNWDQAAIDQAMSFQGKVYSLNWGRTAYNGFFYSKAIFDEYGLSEPKTWDELIDICETLKANGIAPITSGAMDVWPTQMLWDSFPNAFEEDANKYLEGLWTGERQWNDEKSLAMFEKMAVLTNYFEENVINVDYNTVISRFVAGKAAMMNDGTWSAASIDAADPTFEYGYFALPGDTAPADGSDVQLAGKYDTGYAGIATSEHVDEILLWMAFFSEPENYAYFANAASLMPNMDVEITNDFVNSLASKTINFGTAFQNLYRAPTGVGQYAGFKIANLTTMGGSIENVKDLADLAQKDWDDAATAVKAQLGIN